MALGSKSPSLPSSVTNPRGESSSSDLWEEVHSVWTPRAVALTIYGDSDTGRSTLALTAPGPIAYFHDREKTDKILENKRATTLVRQHKFSGELKGTTEQIQTQAQASVSRFEEAMLDAYKWARTIIVDTESRLWEIYQVARLGSMVRAERDGKDNKKGQLIYQEINARWSTWIQQYKFRLDYPLQKSYTNLIMICKTKDEYKKNAQSDRTEQTGKTVIASQKNTWFFSDMVIRTQRKRDKFTATIEKPWWNPEYRDYELKGEDGELDFTYIMSTVTETDTSYWE